MINNNNNIIFFVQTSQKKQTKNICALVVWLHRSAESPDLNLIKILES